ncbi:hypothetical protein POM88_052902 [Heracleum sosnowskyi]|uniref:F-box domain-containing protein n=1 Tax=Heracleum sosnowskyi TaxID=360622 RepID=A0AAD8GRB2_9APIA|nr:hypothetical protein POM88_052902 [Heracleum sosnowskyi]
MASDAVGRAKNSKNTSHIQMIPEDFRCEKHVRNFRDETSSYDTGEKEEEISKSSSRQTQVSSCRKNKKQKRCEFLNHFKDFDKIVRREHCLLPLNKENTSLTISLNRHLDKLKAEHGLTKQTRLQFQKSGNASELKISRASNKKDKNNNSETITDVQTLVPYLHHDIWFDILSWLSAICLYNIMSRVCNTWATIIRHPDFVEKHLLRSRSGIFIQGRTTRFLDLTNNNVEITYIKLKYLGLMRCSYQGISLFYKNVTKANYVVNPVTMQLAQISPPDYKYSSYNGYNVICDRCSGEFKLVFADQQWGGVCSWYVQKLGTENSWKKVSGRHKFSRMEFPGLSVGGFYRLQVCFVLL